jgi:hypothetical protein
MTVTLTANYKEVIAECDVIIIDSIVEEQELPLEYVLECYDYFGIEYTDDLPNIVETLRRVSTIVETLQNLYCEKSELLEFIESYGVENLEYAVDYFELLNDYDADALDAFISIYDVSSLNQFVDCYEGYYSTVSEFVEDYFAKYDLKVPSWVVVDYEATWESALRFDYDEHEGQYFRSC